MKLMDMPMAPTRRAPAADRPWSWRNAMPLTAAALAAAMLLSACNDNSKNTPEATVGTAAPANAAPDQPVAATPVAYTPPSADVLYQMVAPIALYPDKLVAQILAGSTYPDQISAAEVWLGQNPGLKGAALTTGANQQPWDPSVKALTLFPNVVSQLSSNIPWTTALGKAYYNDPTDVLNAIQVMRGRASKAGTLKSSKQLKVQVASAPPVDSSYVPMAGPVSTAAFSPVITPPEEFIQIDQPDPETVYVPRYDPAVAYGAPLPVYHDYQYVVAPPPPPPVVVGVATPVVAGLIGFGAGVLLTESVEHRPSWGWHAWDMHWGRPHPRMEDGAPPPPMARPAVVYNNSTYISRSTTVINNVRNVENVRITENRGAPQQQPPGFTIDTARPDARPPGEMHAGAIAAGAAGVAAAALGAGAQAQRPGQQGGQGLTPPRGDRFGAGMASDANHRQSMAGVQPAAPAMVQPNPVRPGMPHGNPNPDARGPFDGRRNEPARPALAQQQQQQQQQQRVQEQAARQQQQLAQRQAEQQAQQQVAQQRQQRNAEMQQQQQQQQQARQVQAQAAQQQQQAQQRLHEQQAQQAQQQQQRAQEQAARQHQQQLQQQAQQQQQQQQQRAQEQAARQQQQQHAADMQRQLQQQHSQEQAARQQQQQQRLAEMQQRQQQQQQQQAQRQQMQQQQQQQQQQRAQQAAQDRREQQRADGHASNRARDDKHEH